MGNSNIIEFLADLADDDEMLERLVGYAASRGFVLTVSDLKNHFAVAQGGADPESAVEGAPTKAAKKVISEGGQLPDGMLNI